MTMNKPTVSELKHEEVSSVIDGYADARGKVWRILFNDTNRGVYVAKVVPDVVRFYNPIPTQQRGVRFFSLMPIGE